MGKRKVEDHTFWEKKKKKNRRKKKKSTIMISADGKGTVFRVKLKLQEKSFE